MQVEVLYPGWHHLYRPDRELPDRVYYGHREDHQGWGLTLESGDFLPLGGWCFSWRLVRLEGESDEHAFRGA